jgi:hypothetical protein
MVGLAPVHDDPIPHAVLQACKVLAGAKILPLGALAFLGFWRHGNRLCWMLRFEAGASPRLPGGVVVWCGFTGSSNGTGTGGGVTAAG